VERGGRRHALDREVEQGAGLVGGKIFFFLKRKLEPPLTNGSKQIAGNQVFG
jgi:hypothetical protein